jgi:hypothetical protein
MSDRDYKHSYDLLLYPTENAIVADAVTPDARIFVTEWFAKGSWIIGWRDTFTKKTPDLALY